MRISTILLAAVLALPTAGLVAPPSALAQVSCSGDFNQCLAACRAAGISRDECVLMLRQPRSRPTPSTPLVRPNRSKYPPVAQDGSGQRQGPYVNQQ